MKLRGYQGLTVALLLLAGGAAHASERGQLAMSRGLIHFHAAEYAAALPWFDEAYNADPNDPYVLYYSGVTRGRLGDFRAAILDLREALERKPDLDRGALELGIAYFSAGDYASAIPYLQQARRTPELEGDASLYLGRAELQLGHAAEARADLERAARDGGNAIAARYYLGVASFLAGDIDAAETEFRAVVAAAPATDLGRQAAAYLRLIKRFAVVASLGLEYDSNVVLAPLTGGEAFKSALGISDQADGRTTIQLGADYALWRTRRAQLWVGYHFSQTLQFRLTEFDLQDHHPVVELLYDAEPFQLGAVASYDYYILETSSFFQQPLGLLWADLAEGDVARSAVFFRFRYRDFFESPFAGVRNTFNYSGGATQYFFIGKPERYLWGEYRFDKEDPEYTVGLPFGYTGNQVGGGMGWPLPADMSGEAGYAYRHERYRSQSGGRRDNEQLVSVTARRPLTDVFDITGGFFADVNNSNVSVFAYQRYVVSLALEAKF